MLSRGLPARRGTISGMAEPPVPLADRIQEIMDKKDWSQAELARQVEVERNTVSLWVNGPTQKIEYETALRLHQRSGFALHWIITGTGPKTDAAIPSLENDNEVLDWELFELGVRELEKYFRARKLNPSPEEKTRAYRLAYLVLRGEPKRDAIAITRMLRLVVG